ncbi:MAG: DNA translocase FtsK [Oscillospiraceae bacterium]|nr:DNA translocase FtsK [Oscillospiraceae bacterium]
MAEKKKNSNSSAKSTSKPAKKDPPKQSAPPPAGVPVNQTRAIILFAIAILVLLLAFVKGSSGWLALHKALKGFFGLPLLLIPPSLCYIAVRLDKDETPSRILRHSITVVVLTVFLSGFIEIMTGRGRLQDLPLDESIRTLYEEGLTWTGGGIVSIVAYPLQKLFGDAGSKIIICLLLFVSVMLMSKKTLSQFLYMVSTPARRVRDYFQESRDELEFMEEMEQEEEDFAQRTEQEAIAMTRRQPKKLRKEESKPQFLIDIPMEEEILPAPPKSVPEQDLFDIPLPEPTAPPVPEPIPEPEPDPELEEMIRQATAEEEPIAEKPSRQKKEPAPKKRTKEDERLEAMLEIAGEIAQQAEQSRSTERPYQMPELDFLNPGKSHANDPGSGQELREKADLLQEVLKSFNVDARITNIARGPSVTRYEVQPAAGVKVSRITSLSNDIALNFAVEGVRIEAPIPGKPAVGIEVPNSHRDTVSLRELLESKKFSESKSKLTFGVGRDIAGNVIIGDIAKMPHMIIAGATGSGKSVCTNSIIMSILYHATPDEVKLILIDPKIVEFRVYDGIPHLLIPVVTDPKKAAGALNWAVQEMLKRYDIFAENGVRNLGEFNTLCKKNPELTKMPQILICIDELAELMMTASKEVEDAICRLAQLARAAGMHLIIATQRPTTNIITGLIKANIPSRIALSVKAQIDSRVILDTGGAETLLGNGDMLYLPNGQPKPLRVQGCYVSTEEIERVVSFIKEQSQSEYDESIIQAVDQLTVQTPEEKSGGGAPQEEPEIDEDADLIDQAIEVVVAAGQASTSNLQRRLRLGYGRAARIMDELEKMGVIGPYEGAKPRKVMITKEQLNERKLRKMK